MSINYDFPKIRSGGDKYGIGNGDCDFIKNKPILPFSDTYLPPKVRDIDWGPSGPPVRGIQMGPPVNPFR